MDQAPLEYRDIVGFPGYRVGDDGSVWSCRVRGRQGDVWKKLKPARTKNGRYEFVALMREGRAIQHYVHRLVALAFLGPCPGGCEVAHYDGDGLNNRVDNLRYDTHANNMLDRFRHGTVLSGDQIAQATLSPAIVRQIRREFSEGATLATLSRRHGTSQSNVHRVVNRATWRGVI
jgi:hypothetical protein